MDSQPRQHHSSTSPDPDWADIISSCYRDQPEPNTANHMDLGIFDLDSMSAQFGAANDFPSYAPNMDATNDLSSMSPYDNSNIVQYHQHQPLDRREPPISYRHAPNAEEQYMPQRYFGQAPDFDMQHCSGLGINMPPTSHPFEPSIGTQFNGDFTAHGTPRSTSNVFEPDFRAGWQRQEHSVSPQQDIFGDDEDRDTTDSSDPCYAQLLYQCLKQAPDNTLSLRELYDWVSQHSQKGKDPKNRGWQNSVRHNLSMNAAFQRVPQGQHPGPKKASLWRLTEEALRDGVISTTRYRKDPKRKPERRGTPALNRQASGARGGRATRDATRFRHQQRRAWNSLQSGDGHRRIEQSRHGAPYSPYSYNSAETSPHAGFAPATPATSPAYPHDLPHVHTQPLFNPQTPPDHQAFPSTSPSGLYLSYGETAEPKAAPLATFDFLPLDYGQAGLFGNHDPELQFDPNTPTPSLVTNDSVMSDEHMQAFLGNDISNAHTGFQ